MNSNNISLFLFVVAIFVIHDNIVATDATKYIVTNKVPQTPGGKMFDEFIGVKYTYSILPILNEKIFVVLEQKTAAERKQIGVVNVIIDEFDGPEATVSGLDIHINAPLIYKTYYPRANSKFSLTSILIRKMAEMFDWNGNMGAPFGLTEGIAHYVMVKSMLYNETTYTKPGEGRRWDQGEGITERFLEYCDTLVPSFTAKLHKKIYWRYIPAFWVELLGKPVEMVWEEYKAKYGNIK